MIEKTYDDGIRDALAVVFHMKEWIRSCQIDKEQLNEDAHTEFIQHSILWDAEKAIRKLLQQPISPQLIDAFMNGDWDMPCEPKATGEKHE